MDRRSFLQAIAGAGAVSALGMPATPSRAQPGSNRVLRFIPQADLANFDPIWTTAYVVRNAGMLVWDTLYGLDEKLQIQRQMVEAEETSADGLTWTFRLRPGLKFHNGEPVLARDAVASLARWCARDAMGGRIKAVERELVALDDRTFRWSLTRPFPKMLLALGKTSTPVAFIMPASIAATDPFKQIGEYVGSGPMRFKRDEWVPGARAAFEKFAEYQPRAEPASWLAGGKRILVDRIEWTITPDSATAAAALQNGEADWWETPIPDLVPLLRNSRNVVVDINDDLGSLGMCRLNHLHPPFNDARARRALMMAIKQEDYMRAALGDERSLWRTIYGFFTPDTPLFTEEGGDILSQPRNIDAARKLVSEAGLMGFPVVSLQPEDRPIQKAWGDVTNDVLAKIGFKVDAVSTDWGTVVSRRAVKSPPSQGGWNVFHSWFVGADCLNPAVNVMTRAGGDKAWFGWPDIPEVEAETTAWYAAATLEEEKRAVARLNKQAMEKVIQVPVGFYKAHQAWRKNVTGVVKGPLPLFWNVAKQA